MKLSLIISALLCLVMISCTKRVDSGMACISEMTMPRYWMQLSFIDGQSAVARIKLDPNGKVVGGVSDSNDKWVVWALNQMFRENTKYFESCAGRTLEFIVTWQRLSDQDDSPSAYTTFQAPNRFVVSFQTFRPIVDHAPLAR